jgi:hypothetical protein
MPAEAAVAGARLTTNEDVQGVGVRPVTPHNAPIVLVEYDLRWPELLAGEASWIRAGPPAWLAIGVESASAPT